LPFTDPSATAPSSERGLTRKPIEGQIVLSRAVRGRERTTAAGKGGVGFRRCVSKSSCEPMVERSFFHPDFRKVPVGFRRTVLRFGQPRMLGKGRWRTRRWQN
jgi:hypothetical protein